MLNLFTRKLKIPFEVPKFYFLIKKRKEWYIEFTLFFLFFFFVFFVFAFLAVSICSIWPPLRLDVTKQSYMYVPYLWGIKTIKTSQNIEITFGQNFRHLWKISSLFSIFLSDKVLSFYVSPIKWREFQYKLVISKN